MMCSVRNHYVIDMITGVIMANYMYIMAEKLSFLPDVKGLGIPGYKRTRKYYKPCDHCGWGNKCTLDYMHH
jgi:hypothetical protein